MMAFGTPVLPVAIAASLLVPPVSEQLPSLPIPLSTTIDDGHLFRVDPATGAQAVLSSGGNLIDPFGVAVEASGTLW